MDTNYGVTKVYVGRGDYQQHRDAQDKASITGQVSPVPNRQSEQMFHEIGNRFELLSDLIARLELLTDRACGCVPADPKTQSGREAPNTLNDKIGIMIPMLDGANARIVGALQRLESFV